jgi:hypothetical protein
MSRNAGMGILRMIAVLGGASVLIIFVVTAGSAFMPGTKIGHVFKPGEWDENRDSKPSPLSGVAVTAASPDAGTPEYQGR